VVGSCKYCNKYRGGGEEGIILSSWVAISFPRQILLHGASSIFFYISSATFVSKEQG
jgi:hypothetical protein